MKSDRSIAVIDRNQHRRGEVPRAQNNRFQIDPDHGQTALTAGLVAANMCLQGGQQVDVSRYISRTATVVELRVALKPTTATVIIYSPGYEEQSARFSGALSFGSIPIAEPILCIKTVGGPLEFEIDVLGLEEAD
jgi:hypothetical protein